MRILFINLDKGYGVYLIGELFIELLSYLSGISKIDVFTLQCLNIAGSYDFEEYDLVIFNDSTFNIENSIDVTLYKRLKQRNPRAKVICLSHGTDLDYLVNIDFVITLNGLGDIKNGILPLHFIPGNIWEDYKNPRVDEYLICSRICESKIPFNLLCSIDKKVNVCGPILDEDYFLKIQPRINYLGSFSHKVLVNLYNNFTRLLVISNTECLCLPIREALLCGMLVDVFTNNTLYLEDIKDYVNINKPNTNLKPYNKLFDEMFLSFLFILRGITGKDLKVDFNNTPINLLSKIKNEINYKYDILDKQKLRSSLWTSLNNNGLVEQKKSQ